MNASVKTMLLYAVGIIGFIVSIVYAVKGYSTSPETIDGYKNIGAAAVSSAFYSASLLSFAFSIFVFIGARIVQYCDDSLALKEQMNELIKNKIKQSTPWTTVSKKSCPGCGAQIDSDSKACPKCGQKQ